MWRSRWARRYSEGASAWLYRPTNVDVLPHAEHRDELVGIRKQAPGDDEPRAGMRGENVRERPQRELETVGTLRLVATRQQDRSAPDRPEAGAKRSMSTAL